MTWRNVLLPYIRSFSSHLREPGLLSYSSTWCSIRGHVERWMEMKLWKKGIVTSNHYKHHEVEWIVDFYHSQYTLRGYDKPTVVLCVHHLIVEEIFLISEKPKHAQVEGMLDFVQKFHSAVFSLGLIAWNKNWSFLNLYKQYWMSSCSTCLIYNSDTSMSLVMDLIALEESLPIVAWISSINSRVFFSYQNDQREFYEQL